MHRLDQSISRVAPAWAWAPIVGASVLMVSMPLLNACRGAIVGLINGEAYLFSKGFLGSSMSVVGRAAGVACVASLIAIPIAFQINQIRSAVTRAILMAALLLPFFVNESLRAFSWSRVLAADGLIARALSASLGGSAESYSFRFSSQALWFVLTVSILPFGVLAIVPFMPRRDDRRWQAGLELDQNTLIAFARTAVPLAVPGIVLGYLWSFIVAVFSSEEEHYVGDSTSMAKIISGVLNRNLSQSGTEFYLLCVLILATLMGASCIAYIAYICSRHMAQVIGSVMEGALTIAPIRASINRVGLDAFAEKAFVVFRWTLLLFAIGVGLVPVLYTLVLGVASNSESGIISFVRFEAMLESRRTCSAMITSVGIALSVGLIVSIVGTFAASTWLWSRRAAVILFSILWLGAYFPPQAYALSTLQMLGEPSGGVGLLVLMHSIWCLPFAATVVAARIWLIDRNSIAAAIELDGQPSRVWRRVIIPLLRSALVGAFVFGALLSLNESARSAYVRGQVEVLSSRVYGVLESGLVGGNEHIFAAAGTIVLVTIVAGGVVLVWVMIPPLQLKWSLRRSRGSSTLVRLEP